MKPMYPGIPFSPATTLASGIGAADTTIPLTDASVLPDAPNYATIGVDEGGEVILYAAKAGNLLSGCVRAVEGAAQQWNAGSVIGRNWNNIDYQTLADNLREMDSAKAAKSAVITPGNLTAMDSSGDLTDSGIPASGFVDATLTLPGHAADAKAVGDALGSALPTVTPADAGSFLRVSPAGKWRAENVAEAEDVMV